VLQRLRLPVAIVAALVVAEGLVLVMEPRDGLDPVPVPPERYFSAAQIERAEAFRSGQRWLYVARVAAELGLLAVIVRRPPRWLRRALSRPGGLATRRPVLAGAATGAALSAGLAVATLPIAAVSRERAKDVGLVTQGWVGWVGDVALGTAIDAALVAAGGGLLVLGMRRFGRRWWAPAAAAVVAFGVAFTYLSPIVLDPLFNRFRPLEQGELRRDVLALAERAGVQVGEVYVMDASRRTSAANAYVAGLGTTKRVVLYDTLLREFSPDEVRLVVAHELGHVHYSDVPRGLLYLALVAPLGMLAAARLGERLAPPASLGTAAAVPAVVLAVSLLLPAVTMVSNQLSRAVEARADRYSMELTGEPEALIAFQRRIAVQNVSEPAPPAWWSFLMGTHPTTMERIGQALAFERVSRAAGPGAAGPRGGS
jgi:STE24 endopeptidase